MDTANNTPAPKHRSADVRRGHLCREGNAIDRTPKRKVIPDCTSVAINLAFLTLNIMKNIPLELQ
jgi:hypothetical protein